jgi:hypothetical protein
MTLNKKIHETREKLIEVEKAKRKLNGCDDQYKNLLSKHAAAYEQLKKENKDLDNILGLSLSAFIAKIMDNREEKIEKEEREAILAKQIYDGVTYELDELKREIESLNKLVASESTIKAEYEELIKEKKEFLISNNPDMIQVFSQLEEKYHQHALARKEIEEALKAGYRVKTTSSSALESLQKAKNWGTFDLIGGGLIATMAKRDHMESAQTKINRLNHALNNFSQELKDIDQYTTSNIEIGTYYKIGDWLFDGLFVDMMVQNKINEAINQVSRVYDQSIGYVSNFSLMVEEIKTTIEKLDQEAEDLIVTQ